MRLSSFFCCVDAMRRTADFYGSAGLDTTGVRDLLRESYRAQGFYASDHELFYDAEVLCNPAIYPQYVRPPFPVCFVHYRHLGAEDLPQGLSLVPDRAALVLTVPAADGVSPELYIGLFDRFADAPPKHMKGSALMVRGWVFNPVGYSVKLVSPMSPPTRALLEDNNRFAANSRLATELNRETPIVEWVSGVLSTFPLDQQYRLHQESYPEIRTVLSFFAFVNCDNTAEYVRATPYTAKNGDEARRIAKYPGIQQYRTVSLPHSAARAHAPGEHSEDRRRALARAHFRRGHYREYKQGAVTWVKPCRVNAGRPFVDKHYVVKGATT